MAHKDSKMLIEAIQDYQDWIKSVEEHRGKPTGLRCHRILMNFLTFTISKDITWEQMFTLDTLNFSLGFVGLFRPYFGLNSALFLTPP